MTDTAHATPGPVPPPVPPPRSHGCLWGCLVAAGIAVAAIIAATSFGGWYLFSGFKNNETIKAVIVQVNADATARDVLGSHIDVTGLRSSQINADLATGKDEFYEAIVKGDKAEGTLSIKARTPRDGIRQIEELILTGPDGRTHDLLRPPEPSPGSI